MTGGQIMQMDDMVLISVDDHISEPPDLFRNHLSGADLESAPKLLSDKNGGLLDLPA
jgi:hypothetical protein